MKTKRIVAFALALSCASTMFLSNATAASASTADASEFLIPIDYSEYGLGCNVDNVDSSYVDEFFELPLSEIESQLNVMRSEEHGGLIVVGVSNEQLRKLITELEPQKEKIGNDVNLFRMAFFDLFLDKLHLKGIYDTVVSEYTSTMIPSELWDPMNPFVVEESNESDLKLIILQYPHYPEEYAFENGNEKIVVDRYEATQRSLYVINTYGDKDYFTHANEELICGSLSPAVISGDANCDAVVDISDAILVSRVAAEDTSVSLSETGRLNADCDGLSGISAGDASQIIQYIAKLI